MATSILVGPALEQDGRRLLDRLDQAGLPIIAAFWTYPGGAPWDRGEGSLVIASPVVDQEGALPVYRRITAALRQSPALPLSLSAIFAVGAGDPVVHALGRPSPSRGEFDATITFANSAPYAPYLPEGQASLRVHVYRLAPSAVTAACIDTAPGARDDRPEAGGG